MFIGSFLNAVLGVDFLISLSLPLFLFVTLIGSLETVYIHTYLPYQIANLILLTRIKNFLVISLFHNNSNENHSCYNGIWERCLLPIKHIFLTLHSHLMMLFTFEAFSLSLSDLQTIKTLFVSVFQVIPKLRIPIHCGKSVRIRSYSGPYFPAFGLNMDQNNSEYGHFLRSDSCFLRCVCILKIVCSGV